MITVFISGQFNVLHPGHVRLFRFAKQCGDRLIVGVESDQLTNGTALISESLRLEGVQSNSFVDEAFLFNQPISEIITERKPDVVVKGREYEQQFNAEQAAVESYGGTLLFASGSSVFSASELIRREVSRHNEPVGRLPKEYIKRNQISQSHVIEVLREFSNLRVVVIGDLIIDEYVDCEPLGMSQEEPTIVVSPIESKKFIGGAGIVASHAAGLGAKTTFISIAGEDSNRDFAREKLVGSGVNTCLFTDHTRPTTLKQRYRAHGKSLLRVCDLRQDAMPEVLQPVFLEKVLETVQDADLLVFSDFNYGCLPQKLVTKILAEVKDSGVMMAADSQSSSQVGDIARFRYMDLITPTEREARISTKSHEDGLVVLSEKLRKIATAKHVILKMGGDGLLVQTNRSDNTGPHTDQVPALNASPVDTAGAGDSLLISSAMSMALKADIWEMGLVGSVAAAIQVSRLGNVPLTAEELIQEFDKS